MSRRDERAWTWVLLLVGILGVMFLMAAHRDDLRRECVDRGGVPSDSIGYGVRCTEVTP